jgi:hypothetical protein
MTKISSFKIAAGMFGIAALVKITVFAIAVTMLGMATSAQARSVGQPCNAVQQSQWLSLDALQSKVEALGYKVQKVEKNACSELRLALEKSPK